MRGEVGLKGEGTRKREWPDYIGERRESGRRRGEGGGGGESEDKEEAEELE